MEWLICDRPYSRYSTHTATLCITFTTLWANSADCKLMILFFLVFPNDSFLSVHANYLLCVIAWEVQAFWGEIKKKNLYAGLLNITKTRLYNLTPLKPFFYIVKLRFTKVYIIFLILIKKKNNIKCEYPQSMFLSRKNEKHQNFLS